MKKTLLRLGMGVALLAACASCQKLGPLKAEYFEVNPNPLVVKAGKVDGTITATFPEKYFAEKGQVEVITVLKYEGGEAISTLGSSFYQGTKVEGNDTQIQYKAGGTVTQNFSFNYVPEMANSVLALRFKAQLKGKEVEIPEVEIAVGCIATSTLADASSIAPAYAKDNFVRDTKEVTEANVMFDIQSANVKGNDEVKALNAAAAATADDEKRTIDALTLVAAASPDGEEGLNENLANNRQKNTVNYLKKQKNQTAVDAKYIAEDWEGFAKLVAASSVQDKDLILRVLGTYQDPAEREKEIKNLSAAYKELAEDILPQLRRAHLELTVNVAGKTDAELLALAKSNPDTLTVEELMFTATIAENKADADAFTAANAKQNPDDWRTTNNLAASNFTNDDFASAKSNLNTSVDKGGAEQPEPNFNMGLLALVNVDPATAQGYLGKAAGIENLREAQTVMFIQQGEYGKAVAASSGLNTNNAALAQMLVNNNDKASAILNDVESKDALTYYLAAIVAARTSDDANVFANLKEAVAADSALANRAKNDLEFAKYWVVPSFVEVVK